MFLFQRLNYNVTHLNSDESLDRLFLLAREQRPKITVYDTETDGLHHMTSKPFLCTFGFDKELFYVTDTKYFSNILTVASMYATYLFAHNAKFDYHMFTNAGIGFPKNVQLADSITVARLTTYADEDASMSLEALGTRYVDPSAKFAGDVIKKKMNEINAERRNKAKALFKAHFGVKNVTKVFQAYDKRVKYVDDDNEYFKFISEHYKEANYKDVYDVEPQLVINYALDDIVISLEYLKKALPVLEQVDPNFAVFHKECRLIRTIGDMERRGFKADIKYLLDSRLKVMKYKEELYKKLHEISKIKITANQHKVIKAILETKYKVYVDNTDVKALKKIKQEHKGEEVSEFASIITELRTIDKWLSTYIEGMLNRVTTLNGVPRVFSTVNNSGTVTGRVSSDMQQQPKEALFDSNGNELFHPRRVFICDDDYYLFFFDFSNMELRMQAEYTMMLGDGDLNLCRAFMPFKCTSIFTGEEFDYTKGDDYNSGEWVDEKGEFWKPIDLHWATASQAFPYAKDWDKHHPDYAHLRSLGKRANFLKNFGGGEGKLQDSLDIDYETAKALNEAYYKAFPKILDYQRWVTKQLYNVGYVANIFGRRYYMQDSRLFYKCFNYPVQGSCADLVKQKEVEVSELLEDYKSKFVYPIHDELIIAIHKDELDLIEKIREILDDNKEYLTHVPMLCGIDYTTTNWADAKEWEGTIE